MQDYQKRVIAESKELAEKIAKLEYYFFSSKRKELSAKEQYLLSAQLHAMLTYKSILLERIELF